MRDRLQVLAIAAAAIISHASALTGGYVWLDHAHLEEGLALAEPGAWPALFTHGYAGTGFYRPLVSLSLSIDSLVSHSPAFFRAVTLGWHAAASVMTMIAARAIGLSRRGGLIAGLLFAVHPATSLVANAIVFRSESMLAVALLALLVAHLKENPLLAGFTLFAGGLTKETAFVVGPLLVLALEITRRATGAGPWYERGRARLLIAEVVALLAATGLRLLYAPSWRASFDSLPLDQAIGTRLAAFARSARLLVLPTDRSICDAVPITGLTSTEVLLGAAALGGVAFMAWKRPRPALLLGLTLLPSLGLVPLTRFWSPHYLYLALAFGAIWLGAVFDSTAKWAVVATLALGAVYAAVSFQEGRRYRDDVALFTPEVEHRPECREGHFFLGDAARIQSDFHTAAIHYERAAERTPGYLAYVDEIAALQNLGAMRFRLEQWQAAKTAWLVALERSREPDQQRRLAHNLATLALRTGDAELLRRLAPSAPTH